MKRFIIVFCLFVLFAATLYADEFIISEIQCYADNGVGINDEEINFKYDDESNVYYLQRSTFLDSYWFYIYPSDLEKLRANLAKAKEWSKIAKDNKVDVTKEIPNSTISIEATMKSSNDWYHTRRNIPLKFFFVADMEEQICMFIIKGGAQKSLKNEYIEIEFEDLIFVEDQIDDFIDAISPETIEKAIAKHQQKKKSSELFQ